jgi:DNA-binding NarL/FixJ family response regulator
VSDASNPDESGSPDPGVGRPEPILGLGALLARARMGQSARVMKIVAAEEPRPDDTPVRVLVAVGEGLLRASLRFLLERQDGITVVADADSGVAAVAAASRTRPDVVVMDAGPASAGVEATRRIVAGEPHAPGVVLLVDGSAGDVLFAALRAGAAGLLLRDAEPAALVQAVRVVAAGETLLAPPLTTRLVEDFLARPDRLKAKPEQLDELTTREREVLALVASGLSNEEIAERLVVTRATVKTHVSRALYKLHARDRAQLVVLAYECGLVSPGPRWSRHADASLAFSARIPRLRAA